MTAKKGTTGRGTDLKKLKLRMETLKDLGVKGKDRDAKGGLSPRTGGCISAGCTTEFLKS
jgi:hypothetical protein